MELQKPEDSPAEVVSAIDQPPPQVAGSLTPHGPTSRCSQQSAVKVSEFLIHYGLSNVGSKLDVCRAGFTV